MRRFFLAAVMFGMAAGAQAADMPDFLRGSITAPSPTLNRNIGLCYLPIEEAKEGTSIEVVVRNQPVEAETVPTPFYRRPA